MYRKNENLGNLLLVNSYYYFLEIVLSFCYKRVYNFGVILKLDFWSF